MMIGLTFIVLMLIILDLGSSFLTEIVGLFYPSYMSFKDIRNIDDNS